MEPMIEILEANTQAAAIRDIYAKLRNMGNSHNRTPLLRQAEQYADALSHTLRQVAENTSGATLDAETLVALQELGATMDALMVQEREYRISAGGDDIPLPQEA
jgi:hypothetical protein